MESQKRKIGEASRWRMTRLAELVLVPWADVLEFARSSGLVQEDRSGVYVDGKDVQVIVDHFKSQDVEVDDADPDRPNWRG